MKMKRLGLLLLASCLAALSSFHLAACGQDTGVTCTAMGCMSTLTLDMPEEGLAPGLWVFEVDADDDRRWICEASIPFEREGGASCDGPYGGVLARFYGDPVPAYFEIIGNPATVSVKVTHEDVIVLQRVIEPMYETFTVDNGHEFCNLTCAAARLPLWPEDD